MCPDRKLKWFSDQGYSTDKIRERVLTRFNETYAHDPYEEPQKPLLGQRMLAKVCLSISSIDSFPHTHQFFL
jgi:hypothetical protein